MRGQKMITRTAESDGVLGPEEIRTAVIDAIYEYGPFRKVLAVPPDISRYHSQAGTVLALVYEQLGPALNTVLPALGTHQPMTSEEISLMYPDVPGSLFRVHNWRTDVDTIGVVPGSTIRDLSEGALDFSWPVQVNRLLLDRSYDCVLSVGQVVPHEVAGMANGSKNIFIGTGGYPGIDRSHFLGAVYGMERIMGEAENPVRSLLQEAEKLTAGRIPILYILTVVGTDQNGTPGLKGLFIGTDHDCFMNAAALSARENVTYLESRPKTIVAYLDEREFHSTWLGNKAIYRTRKAIADGGRLIILAPGVRAFGEDPGNDRVIRRYGYAGTERILNLVQTEESLQDSLSAAAHLIHGSTENRFEVIYCPGGLSQEEIESVGYRYGRYEETAHSFSLNRLQDGWNDTSEGPVYYVSRPSLGLWTAAR
jgi:nickel-dependent lactate racemase